MKRLLVSFGLFACASISAHAADPQAAVDTLATAPVASWTGCYAGGNIGGAWSRVSQRLVADDLDLGSGNGDGFIGGAQIGCDYQLDRWVFGAQAMFDFGSIRSSHAAPVDRPIDLEDELKTLVTVTGRAGYLIDPAVLGYVKAGGALTRVDTRLTSGDVALSESYDRLGWTVGVGAEWQFAANWSVFGEYNYLDFGKHNVAYGELGDVSTRLDVQQAVFGLNYRF